MQFGGILQKTIAAIIEDRAPLGNKQEQDIQNIFQNYSTNTRRPI